MPPDKRPTSPVTGLSTTFLVPNIHCATCTDFINNLLLHLDPPPSSVTTTIVNHTVTVEHSPEFDPRMAARALASSGYEVDSVIPSSRLQQVTEAAGPSDDNFPVPWLNNLANMWSKGSDGPEEETTRLEHAKNCRHCQESTSGELVPADDSEKDTAETASPDGKAASFVVVGSSEPPQAYQAVLEISGMSCSSCVGKITEALEAKPWISSASVGLLTHTATVGFYGKEHAGELARVIASVGYEATLGELTQVAGAGAPSDTWQASLSVGGMTCSSCVGTITKAVERLPWTKSVDVNLITTSATVVFEEKDNLREIIATIQGVGYTASLNDLVNVADGRGRDSRRSLTVHVAGMYCQHCPRKVIEAVVTFGDAVVVDKPPTLDMPYATFSYTPQAPSLTVRHIVSALSAADPAFTVTTYHPPTVEERSRQLVRRTMLRIFYRVTLSLVAAIPALIIGVVYMNLVSSNDPGQRYLMSTLKGVSRAEWANLAIATPVYFFATDVFHRRTIKELYNLWRHGSPTPILRRFYRFGSMDMLISFATTIAYFGSIVEIVIATTLPDDGYHMQKTKTHLDAVVFLTLFLLIGRLIEAYTKAKTGDAVSKLGSLRPKEAILLTKDPNEEAMKSQNVPIDMLDVGDLVRVVHGGSPPWDGILVDGEAEFIESSLTGESRPIQKKLGDAVYSGTINKGGPIAMRITGAAGDSLLDQIIKVVREGQSRRAPIERVADTITGYFVPLVTLVAIVTWVTWLCLGESGRLPPSYRDTAIGGWPFWSLQFAIAVFVIACPCGIGLAAPTALFVGGGLAAKHGILAKGGGEAFQEASKLDIVVFDKTGTLTQGGEPKLTDHRFLTPANDATWSEQVVSSCLNELEGNSSHPIAKAIVSFFMSRGVEPLKPQQVKEVPGKGIHGSFLPVSSPGPIEVIMGNEALMADYQVVFDRHVLDELDTWKDQAKSVVLAAGRVVEPGGPSAWSPLAICAVSDALRPEAAPVLKALRKQGIDVWILSGDNPKTANAVGAMVGIPPENIIAGVLPEQKAEKIQYLQKSQVKVDRGFIGLGKPVSRRPTVAMVGDGVNDSPALTVADVGIAIGSGSDVAISAAEFVLVNSNLYTLLTLASLSRVVFRRVKFNFIWASVYNLIALPVAAGVLYSIKTNGGHTRLDPVWAALAMALSSISVITSSLLLKTRLPVLGYRYTKPEAAREN